MTILGLKEKAYCTDEAEQQMGTEHVTGRINALRQYADTIAELKNWLNSEV